MEKLKQQPNIEPVNGLTKPTSNSEQFEQERVFRAKERNGYRTIWQKMYGREKNTCMDVAIEEALEMDTAIEKELKEGRAETMEDALNNINQLPKFQLKGTEQIEKEEYARAKTLQISKAIVSNDFNKAASLLIGADSFFILLEQGTKGLNEETATKQIINENINALAKVVKEHVGDLARAKDGKNFADVIHWFSTFLESGDLPTEAVKSPEIVGAIREHLFSFFRALYDHPAEIEKELERFSRLGLINEDEKDKIVHSSEMKLFAKEEAISCFNAFSRDPKIFREKWTDLENLGSISIEQILQIPEIRKKAKQTLRDDLRLSNYSEYGRLRYHYLALGIIDIEEVESLPEVVELRDRGELH